MMSLSILSIYVRFPGFGLLFLGIHNGERVTNFPVDAGRNITPEPLYYYTHKNLANKRYVL